MKIGIILWNYAVESRSYRNANCMGKGKTNEYELCLLAKAWFYACGLECGRYVREGRAHGWLFM